MGATFTVNQGLLEALTKEPEWRQLALERAKEVAQTARDLKHRHGGFSSTDYRAKQTPTSTMVVIYGSFWHLDEFGSIKSPPLAPVRHAFEGAGLELVDITPHPPGES